MKRPKNKIQSKQNLLNPYHSKTMNGLNKIITGSPVKIQKQKTKNGLQKVTISVCLSNANYTVTAEGQNYFKALYRAKSSLRTMIKNNKSAKEQNNGSTKNRTFKRKKSA